MRFECATLEYERAKFQGPNVHKSYFKKSKSISELKQRQIDSQGEYQEKVRLAHKCKHEYEIALPRYTSDLHEVLRECELGVQKCLVEYAALTDAKILAVAQCTSPGNGEGLRDIAEYHIADIPLLQTQVVQSNSFGVDLGVLTDREKQQEPVPIVVVTLTEYISTNLDSTVQISNAQRLVASLETGSLI